MLARVLAVHGIVLDEWLGLEKLIHSLAQLSEDERTVLWGNLQILLQGNRFAGLLPLPLGVQVNEGIAGWKPVIIRGCGGGSLRPEYDGAGTDLSENGDNQDVAGL